MRNILAFAIGVCLVLGTSTVAHADRVVARVTLSQQVMHVYHNGLLVHEWPVSTARAGKITPTGQFTAQWLSRNHRSSRYNNAPMPYSIFYSGHYAIHGTDQVNYLGRPASAGCVRLHPDNARVLFELARSEGLEQTAVVIVN